MLIVLVLLAVLGVGFAAFWLYGRFAPRGAGKPSYALPADCTDTDLDRLVAPMLAQHPGQSGFSLLASNLDAFAARALTARHACRSLDLQYYIWKDDLTGRLLAREIADAADRGVRVRLLLDDINARGLDPIYLALDRHDNVEVRMFNPSRNREGALGRALELLVRAMTLNRRMHNKAWIAGGRILIVGGRNVGDEYFDAAEQSNFQDLDLLAVGPVVRQAETSFDAFWNSSVVLPIARLHPLRRRNILAARARLGAMATQERATPYLERVAQSRGVQDLLAGQLVSFWTAEAQLLSDSPEKALGRQGASWMMDTLAPLMASAQREVQIVSPYFVPGTAGTDLLRDIVAAGAEVAVLTNSLAATDVAAVHGAYAPYRAPLLGCGVSLFELKPVIRQRIRLLGSGTASLHTKAFLVDRRAAFIGSANFDPRSLSLNTEMGVVLVESALVDELHTIVADQMSAAASFRLTLEDDVIVWHDDEEDPPRRWFRDPEAGVGRRLACGLLRVLPLESLM